MADILLFVSSMQGGGAERNAALLANDWVARGHSVAIVATFSGRGECAYPLHAKVQMLFLADLVGSARRSALNRLKRLYAVRRLLRERRPDCVVSFMTQVNIAVLLASMHLGIRVVISERVYPPLHPTSVLVAWARRRLYPYSDLVVMQTARGLQWLEHEIPGATGEVIANSVVYPVPTGVGAQISLNSATDDHLILAVGRLDPQKGFDLLIDAFAQVAADSPQWHLVILGEGEQRDALEKRVVGHDMQERIRLPGHAGNVAEWYERADLFVLSSRYEGFPNALLEAMSYGLPVISTACDSGPEDIVEHGVDGLLVTMEAGARGLQQMLAQLIADPELRLSLGQAALTVRDRYAVAGVSARWLQVLGVE